MNLKEMIQADEQNAKRLITESSVMVGIPCYGGNITEGTFSSVINLTVMALQLGMKMTFETLSNESFISRGRNSLAAKFLAGTYSHLMFIDADIQFNAEDVVRLVLHDQDVVGGVYPQKTIPPKMVVNTLDNAETQGDLLEVGTLGTGFMLIKRQVFIKLVSENIVDNYVDSIGLSEEFEKHQFTFFDSMLDTQKRYLTDDWAFCRRSRQAGFKIWADKTIELIHSGYMRFFPDMTQLEGKKDG